MKMTKALAASLLALSLALTGASAAHALQGPPPPGYGPQGPPPAPPGWDRVPSNYRSSVEQRPYH